MKNLIFSVAAALVPALCMADAWEREHGLDPSDPADRNGLGSNGYTNLENYLNSIAP